MSAPPRSLRQPGPASAERVTSHDGEVVALDFILEPGLTLNEAIARPMRKAGIAGGTAELEGGAFGPPLPTSCRLFGRGALRRLLQSELPSVRVVTARTRQRHVR